MVADIAGGAGYLADLYRTPPRESEPALINTTSARDAAAVPPVERSATDQNRAGDDRQTRSAAAEGFGQAVGDRLDASTNAALLQAQEARVQSRPEQDRPTAPPTQDATRQSREERDVSVETREAPAPAANETRANALSDTLTRAREAETAERQARAAEARNADEARDTRRLDTQTVETRTVTEDTRPQDAQAQAARPVETERNDTAPVQSDAIEAGLNPAARASDAINPTTAALEQSSAVNRADPRNAAAETAVDAAEADDDDNASGLSSARPESDTVNDAEAEVTTPNTQFETRFARAESGLSTRDDGISRTDPNPATADRLSETTPDPQRARPVNQPLDNNLDGAVTPQEIAQGGVNLTV
ncbi:hypothetical protein [Oceanicaulis sp.]|uniref:hypothetical protein n=1 Tax=Oceanicaulis sp. TaxID=1924941 RepID=UPI003F6EC8DD